MNHQFYSLKRNICASEIDFAITIGENIILQKYQ
jgi:hypothetical protein